MFYSPELKLIGGGVSLWLVGAASASWSLLVGTLELFTRSDLTEKGTRRLFWLLFFCDFRRKGGVLEVVFGSILVGFRRGRRWVLAAWFLLPEKGENEQKREVVGLLVCWKK